MLVNWDGERRSPCPCGKGESAHRWTEYGSFSGMSSEEWVMLCPECKGQYVFDRRDAASGAYGEITRRGWVPRAVVQEEEKYHQHLRVYQRSIVQKVDELCRDTWRKKLATCKSKKAVWALNEREQAYETFTSHHRGKSLQQVVQEQSDRPFYFSEARHVLSVCGIESDPESLAAMEKPTPPPSLPGAFQDAWERGWDFMDRGPIDLSEQE